MRSSSTTSSSPSVLPRSTVLSRSSVFSRTAMTTQYTDKCGTEIAVKDGVDERIESRVAVTEPEDDGEQAVWNVEVEQQRERVDGEERKPASDERCHYDAENEGRATFTGSS